MEERNSIMLDSSEDKLILKLREDQIKPISMKKLEQKLAPLDLIFFSGNEGISKLIRLLQKVKIGFSEFSHVGILVTRDLFPNCSDLEPGKYYIWESTASLPLVTDGVKDVRGKPRFGVQMRDFEEVLSKYSGKVYWGRCMHNPWKIRRNENLAEAVERRQRIIQKMQHIYDTYGSRLYDASFIDLFSSLYPSLRPLRKIKEKMQYLAYRVFRPKKKLPEILGPVFCSEFVAIIYQELEILDKKISPRNFVPVDFTGHDLDGSPSVLAKVCCISSE